MLQCEGRCEGMSGHMVRKNICEFLRTYFLYLCFCLQLWPCLRDGWDGKGWEIEQSSSQNDRVRSIVNTEPR